MSGKNQGGKPTAKSEFKIAKKTYRLLNDVSPKTFLLKTGRNNDLLIFDPEEGVNRAIRFAPNERSIFVDEQSDFANVKPIIFESGYLQTKDTDVNLQAFLDSHPGNKANGGGIFELVDPEKDAREANKKEDLILDIKFAVRQKEKQKDGVFALETVAAVLKGNIADVRGLTPDELKRVIYAEAEKNPTRFVDSKGNVTIFEEDKTARKYLVLRAMHDGVIKTSANNRMITWDDGTKIVDVPISIRPTDFLTDFLQTEDGMLLAEEITKRS